jgi:2-polyprenyl-3-methyl-5-hydroxy-6-metoxy-1,4-benzoquinol methylase
MTRVGAASEVYGYREAVEQAHHKLLLPIVLDLLPERSGLDVLDVGCGTGFVAHELAKRGHKVVGIDVATDGIELARRAFPNVTFFVASAYDDLSGLAPGVWDVVLAVEVIEHLYSPQRFLENAFSCLRPGGLVVLTTPYHGYLKNLALAILNAWDKHLTVHWEGGHIKFFSRRTLESMLKDIGFVEPVFRFAGRVPFLWKDMICLARKPQV